MPTLTLGVDEDDRLIREGEEQVQPFQDDLANAHSRIVVLAKGLAAAKRKYPNTARFGAWLASSPYGRLGDTARSCLIKLGENEAEAEPILRTTKSASPELIWKEVKTARQVPSARNSTEQPGRNPFIEGVVKTLRTIPSPGLERKLDEVARGDGTHMLEVAAELRRVVARLNRHIEALSALELTPNDGDLPPHRLN